MKTLEEIQEELRTADAQLFDRLTVQREAIAARWRSYCQERMDDPNCLWDYEYMKTIDRLLDMIREGPPKPSGQFCTVCGQPNAIERTGSDGKKLWICTEWQRHYQDA